jgi:hypothetical protein
MVVKVDLIVPGLFDLPVDELDPRFLKLELPALNQVLRFAQRRQNHAFDLESILIQAMGWTGLLTLPFAQAYVTQEEQTSDNYLLFRPIHLRADMHSAIVLPIDTNRINGDDIDIIIKDLKELFTVDCEVFKVQEELWLMRLKQCIPAQHYPHYLSVLGKKSDPFVQQSKQYLPWYKLINEMQMFMHQHEINRNRIESGLLPINSLWFWGAGNLSKLAAANINWYCDDPLLKQFAAVANINCATLDDFRTLGIDCDSLVIDLSLLEALKSSHESKLQELLSNIEERLFKSVLKLVRERQCVLRLISGSQFDLKMTAYSTFQWWKKSKSLVELAGI